MSIETSGQKNLIRLFLGVCVLAFAMTGTSLYLYKVSGDIYLDRSRPGFLPEKEEAQEETSESMNYSYSDSGPLDAEELREYRTELRKMIDRLEQSTPYADAPLSDESLGITKNN